MLDIKGASLIEFDVHGDSRGALVAVNALRDIDFEIRRVYYIFNTKEDVIRGHHAHRNLKQVLLCVNGSCQIYLDDGTNQETVLLSKPNCGLYIDGLIWREMMNFSEDCVLLVLASELYDPEEYIRDYEQFRREIGGKP